MVELPFPDDIVFAAGRLCLDFVNTACERLGTPLDFMGNPDELWAWLKGAERAWGVSLAPGDDWSDEAGAEMLAQGAALRSALNTLVRCDRTDRRALETLNSVLTANPFYRSLEVRDGRIAEVNRPLRVNTAWLGLIAEDAADFLAHADFSLVRECECPTCIRLFYDTTKNHKRRWCVERCGNRTKAAAYYRRKKELSAQGS